MLIRVHCTSDRLTLDKPQSLHFIIISSYIPPSPNLTAAHFIMNTDQHQQDSSCMDPREMISFSAPLSPPESRSGAGSSIPDTSSARLSTSISNKKKRKSWGQVLPEPTTNLPPRKRAKTEAEKQQRLYERVQRNRAAAHNSRMRKQNEMEDVIAQNNMLQQDVQALRMEVDRLKEENLRLRQQPKQEPIPTSEFDSSSL